MNVHGTSGRELSVLSIQGMVDADASMPDWKRRQQIQPAPPRLLQPTVGQRVARLNPFERHAVQQLMQSMILRKTIKRVLVEAYHGSRVSRLMQTEPTPALPTNCDDVSTRSETRADVYTCDECGPVPCKHMRIVEHPGAGSTMHADFR